MRLLTLDELRGMAERKELTHQKIADEIGCSRETVTRCLNGGKVDPSTRYAVAKVIGTDSVWVDWRKEE